LKAGAIEEDFPSILGMDEPESSVVDDLLNCSLHVASIVVVCGFCGNNWERLGGWPVAGNPRFSLRSDSIKCGTALSKAPHLFSSVPYLFSYHL